MKKLKLILLALVIYIGQLHAGQMLGQEVVIRLKKTTLETVFGEIEKQTGYAFLYEESIPTETFDADFEGVELSEVLNEILAPFDLDFYQRGKQIVIFEEKVAAAQPEARPAQQNPGRTVSGVVTGSDGEPLVGAMVQVEGTQSMAITDATGRYLLGNVVGDGTLVVSYFGYNTVEIQLGTRSEVNVTLTEDVQRMQEVVVVGYGTQVKENLTGSVSSIAANQLTNRPTTNLTAALSGLAAGVQISQGRGDPGNEDTSILVRGLGSINGSAPMVLVDGVVADMSVINPDDVESISILKDAASAAIYGSRAANGVVLVTTKKGRRSAPTVTISGLWAQEKAESGVKFFSDMPRYMEILREGQRNVNPYVEPDFFSQQMIDDWRAANANPNGIYTDPITGNKVANKIAFPNTNWAQEIFKPAFYHRYNMSVSGGSDDVTYLLSASYQDNPGALENTGLQRYNIRANVESKVAKFLTIGTQTYATKEFKEPGDINLTSFYQAFPGMNPKIDGKYGIAEDPSMPNQNNLLHTIAATGGMKEYSRINTTWYANADIWNGISLEAKFNFSEYQREDATYTKDLPRYSFRQGTEKPVENIGNLEQATTSRYSYQDMSYTADLILRYNGSFGEHDINAFAGYEQYYRRTTGFRLTTKGLLDWDVTDINAGGTMDSFGSDTQKRDDAKKTLGILSYFGRVNYAFKNRYLFEANLRADGSSRFAPGHRWGTFPSFSAGWRISEEPFFEGARHILSNLKLKASWGQLGNQASGYYDWQAIYGKKPVAMDGGVANGLAQTQMPNLLMTWEKTTSTNIGFEAGFFDQRLTVEFDYFRRMTTDMLVSPNVYLSMGYTSGDSAISVPKVNAAAMKAGGFDVSLGWRDKVGDFRYAINANVSYSTNKIDKFQGRLKYEADPATLDIWGNPTMRYTNLSEAGSINSNRMVSEGHEYYEFFMKTAYQGSGNYFNGDGSVNPNGGPRDGMVRSKDDLEWLRAMVAEGYTFNDGQVIKPDGANSLWYGTLLLADNNGDGRYGGSDDRVFIGKSNYPKVVLGLNMSFEYKGIDLSMGWAGRFGSWHYIYQRGVNGSYANQNRNAINADHDKLYYSYDAVKAAENGGFNDYDPSKDTNYNAKGRYPRLLRDAGNGYASASSYYVYNSSYFKLKSLQLGYTLPKRWTSSMKMSSLRVYFAGENLLTFKSKNYPGVDPELGDGVNVYPLSRILSGGVTITF